MMEDPTWASILKRWRNQTLTDLQNNLEFNRPRLHAAMSSREMLTGTPLLSSLSALFPGIGSVIARTAVLRGAHACLPAIGVWSEYFPMAIQQLDSILNDNPDLAVDMVYLLAYGNCERCCTNALPDRTAAIEGRWLHALAPRAKRLLRGQRIAGACACLAAREPDLVPLFIGGGKVPMKAVGGKAFDASAEKAIRYIATCLKGGQPADAVLPALLSLVANFPAMLAREDLGWADLLCCAYTVMVHFEHRPPHEVADGLHRLIPAE